MRSFTVLNTVPTDNILYSEFQIITALKLRIGTKAFKDNNALTVIERIKDGVYKVKLSGVSRIPRNQVLSQWHYN